MTRPPVIPDWVWTHTVEWEPLTGHNATGPVYGEPEVLRCRVSPVKRGPRSATSSESTARLSIHFPAGTTYRGAALAQHARVTHPDGSVGRALEVHHRNGGGHLPTPDHVHVLAE